MLLNNHCTVLFLVLVNEYFQSLQQPAYMVSKKKWSVKCNVYIYIVLDYNVELYKIDMEL